MTASVGFAQAFQATPPPQTPPQTATDGGVAVVAIPKPDPEAVQAVWGFYYGGKGLGLVLADTRLCTKINKDGPHKFECADEVDAGSVKVGTTITVWQAYLVPQGDSIDDITVQLKQGDTVRETKDVKVNGDSWRTRIWTTFRLPKPGDWTIVIARGPAVLKTLTVKAIK